MDDYGQPPEGSKFFLYTVTDCSGNKSYGGFIADSPEAAKDIDLLKLYPVGTPCIITEITEAKFKEFMRITGPEE